MRRPQPPPTKEGNTGERIDTNTFVANTGTLSYLLPCDINQFVILCGLSQYMKGHEGNVYWRKEYLS